MKSQKKISRRQLLALLGIAAAGTVLDARFFEPRWLGVGRHTINLPNRSISRPIKVLHLSDFHASSFVPLEFIAKAVRMGLDLKPDLALLTGDFVTGKFAELSRYAEILATIAETVPSFACFGNHDGGLWAGARQGYSNTEQVRQLLAKSGITLLHNTSTITRIKGENFHLVGLGDLWAEEFAPAQAFISGRPDKNTATLVLSHNPDTKEQLKIHDWDVVFCGHTHGGQFYLPLIGTPFAPVRDKRFVKGLHQWEGRWIHITKGVGNLLGFRFNCRPEISLVTLS